MAIMKIVIIKYGALGDIIISTPIIRKILDEHAEDQVFLLTSLDYAALFKDWNGLDVYQSPRKGFIASIKTLSWFRQQKFDRVYDLQSNDRSRILCSLSAIKEKVGNHNHFPYTHHPGDRYTGQNHIFHRHNQLLNSIGISNADTKPSLPIPDIAERQVSQWLDKHALSEKRIVLMHAGASLTHLNKRWPYFLDLAKKLISVGYEILWLGADDDVELNENLAKHIGIDASNCFNITELIALGQRAEFAVTNDSGPMHVLSCAGIPVYAVFGPTNWRRNHAIAQIDHVLSLDKSNSVWSAEENTQLDKTNLGLISAEMVFSLLIKENQIVLETLG
jgi:ADP-heptose:LPS heptosyltransferase